MGKKSNKPSTAAVAVAGSAVGAIAMVMAIVMMGAGDVVPEPAAPIEAVVEPEVKKPTGPEIVPIEMPEADVEPETITTGNSTSVKLAKEGDAAAPVFAPDGSAIALELHGRINMKTIEIVPMTSNGAAVSASVQAPPDAAQMPDQIRPVWLPDGRLAFTAVPRGRNKGRPYAIKPGAIATPAPLPTTDPPVDIEGLSAGEHAIAWVQEGDIWLRDEDGAGDPRRLLETEERERDPLISPSGGDILFRRGAKGEQDLYSLPLAVPEGETSEPEPRAESAGEQLGASWVTGGIVHLTRSRSGKVDVIHQPQGGEPTVLAIDIRSQLGPIAKMPGSDWIAWVPKAPAGQITLYDLTAGQEHAFRTGLLVADEPAFGVRGETVWLAYTGRARESTSQSTQLFIADITDEVAKAPE